MEFSDKRSGITFGDPCGGGASDTPGAGCRPRFYFPVSPAELRNSPDSGWIKKFAGFPGWPCNFLLKGAGLPSVIPVGEASDTPGAGCRPRFYFPVSPAELKNSPDFPEKGAILWLKDRDYLRWSLWGGASDTPGAGCRLRFYFPVSPAELKNSPDFLEKNGILW